ncbi:MAG: polyprenyl synthetase family protein, partial [Sediminibacterium sp.]|nr:polyprenyl synthetase family protein [Sediminibacterium sp.]
MLDSIKLLLQTELTFFDIFFKNSIKSKVPLLDTIMLYILKRKGKKIRPLFVFLIANIAGKVQSKTYRAAALIELLHTATLVHDDVVDETMERRGAFSINALWKNKAAVLVGDYLLSKGLLISLENDDFDILKIVSTAVKKMSEGELLQLEKSRSLNINEETYFKIIQYKTASLLTAACAVGAASVSADNALIEDMKLLGENIGIAFQLKDDLLDYSNQKIGKPT